jgi:chromosome condensin MukBEF ATPase and DNA-binding subunit MukB
MSDLFLNKNYKEDYLRDLLDYYSLLDYTSSKSDTKKNSDNNYVQNKLFDDSPQKSSQVLNKIIDLRDLIRSPYKNPPTHTYIDTVLTFAIAEITNLNKKIQRLEKDLNSSNENTIEIKIGDEIVIIDNDLADHVISAGVKEYIIKAIKSSLENQPYDE